MRGLRLIPIVLFATASLFVLKTAGILTGGGYLFKGVPDARAQTVTPAPRPLDPGAAPLVPSVKPAPAPGRSPAREGAAPDITGSIEQTESPFPARTLPAAEPKRSWAHQMFGYPDITGSVDGATPAAAREPAKAQAEAAPAEAGRPAHPPATRVSTTGRGPVVSLEDRQQPSAGERAVLERLQERRQELEARSRELDVREGLLRAAEKRLEARLGELKELEAQIGAANQKRDEAETGRLKALVTMYENMKAKEAARIFERLEQRVLIDVAAMINPRRMSEILAQMSPESAQRLTVDLANRSNTGSRPASPEDLPKIEGRPRS